MRSPLVVGYTGALLVQLAGLLAVSHVALVPRAAPGTLALLSTASVLCWIAGSRHASRAPTGAASSLSAAADALWPLSLCTLAYLSPSNRYAPVLALLLALATQQWLGHRRVVRSAGSDVLFPYFFALSGGLLVPIARTMLGLALLDALGLLAAFGASLGCVWAPLHPGLRRHFSFAALGVLAPAVAAGAWLPERPSPGRLLLLLGVTLVLAWLAWAARSLGPSCRLFGLAAWAGLTLMLWALLRHLGSSSFGLLLATTAWVLALTLLGMAAAGSEASEPFRESAHWLASLLGLGIVFFWAAAWWPRGSAFAWSPPAANVPATVAALAVAGALSALGLWRRRHPVIALSALGLMSNLALTTVVSFLPPLLFAPAGSGLWAGAWQSRLLAAFWPLLLAGLYFTALDARQRWYPRTALHLAGYVAIGGAVAWAWRDSVLAFAVLLFAAVLLLWRSAREGGLLPHVGGLAALAAAAGLLAFHVRGGDESSGLAFVALGVLLLYRLFLHREGVTLRTGLTLGWGVGLCAAVLAVDLWRSHLSPWPLAALWAGSLGILLGGRDPRAGASYEPRVFLTDWIETTAFTVAHAAGAAFLVAAWLAGGMPLGASGPLLAVLAHLHLAGRLRLDPHRRNWPLAAATGAAVHSLALGAVVVPLAAAGGPAVLAASLLLDAALYLSVEGRALRAVGYAALLVALAAGWSGSDGLFLAVLLGAAIVCLSRSLRDRGLPAELSLLALFSGAAWVAATRLSFGMPLAAVLSVGLLAVSSLQRALDRAPVDARFGLVWALGAGLVAVPGASALGAFSPEACGLIWLSYLLALEQWDEPPAGAKLRPGDPEDRLLSIAGYWLAHAAGAAWLLAQPWGGASLAAASFRLALWAGLHHAAAILLERRGARALTTVTGQAAHALAALSLALAGLHTERSAWAVLAAASVGSVYLALQRGRPVPWMRHASAVAWIEAVWLWGRASGYVLLEFYLAPVAAYLYLLLWREQRAASLGGGVRDSAEGAAASRQQALLPFGLFLVALAGPFVALLRSHDVVHLLSLGAATLVLLPALLARRPNAPFGYLACALLLAGTLSFVAFGGKGGLAVSTIAALGALLLIRAALLASQGQRAVDGRLPGDHPSRR